MPLKPLFAAILLGLGLLPGSSTWAAPPSATGKIASTTLGSEDPYASGILQTLVAEFAQRSGDDKLAADIWADLAQRTQDPKAYARATETAAQARQFERALELSRQWQALDPDSIKARQIRISLLILGKRSDELAPQYAALLAQDKDSLPANLLHLNRSLSRLGDPQVALQLVERITAPYDDLAEAHVALAEAAANAGSASRALEETTKALQLRPDWEGVALIRAQLLAKQSSGDAIRELGRFLERSPQSKEARLMLARLLVSEKRYDDAGKQFDILLRDNPDSPDVIYPVAVLALQRGDLSSGRKQLEHLLETDFADKFTVHYLLGQLDQGQNNLDAALAHYRVVSSGEQYFAARSRSAQILVQQGKTEEARQLLRETRSSNANQHAALAQAEAQILREAGRYNDAYIVLQNALTAHPNDVELMYDIALVAERLNKPDIMETHLRQVLNLKPDHAHALNALGYSLAERNTRLDEAVTLIRQALALSPKDAFIMDSLGWVLFRQGDLNGARETLEKAYAIKADPEIAAHLTEVLWTLGREEDARRLLREAIKNNPGNEILNAAAAKYLP